MFFPGSSEYNYKPSLGSSINWNHPLSEGLIACYLFNEVSGLKSYDISRYNVAGTLTNGALFSNIDGGIVTLDGVNDYISLQQTPIVNTGQVTLEVWFRTTQTSQALILQTVNYGSGIYLSGIYLSGICGNGMYRGGVYPGGACPLYRCPARGFFVTASRGDD